FPYQRPRRGRFKSAWRSPYAHPTGFLTKKLTTCYYWCNIPIDGKVRYTLMGRAAAINYLLIKRSIEENGRFGK
ncbi:MAG: hypothetical protein KAR83_08110, partial [Thermodesulfovibrionales bacterium]|nr:hypothetical protein [Thermodesulfovibrionales bacterium]